MSSKAVKVFINITNTFHTKICVICKKKWKFITLFQYLIYNFDDRGSGGKKKASIDSFCKNGNLPTIDWPLQQQKFQIWYMRCSQRCWQELKVIGLRRSIKGRIVTNILQDGNVFMFRVRQTVCLEMLDPEVDGTATLPNAGYLLGQRQSITSLKTQNLIHIICIQTSQKRGEYYDITHTSGRYPWIFFMITPCIIVINHYINQLMHSLL